MHQHRTGHAIWLLPWLILVTPLILPGAGSDRSKPLKAAKEQREPSAITAILYRIIANEWQTRMKLEEYSPRVETYVQYYKPDPELGDQATDDDYFLGRLKFDWDRLKISTRAKEASFLPHSSSSRRPNLTDIVTAHFRMDEYDVQLLRGRADSAVPPGAHLHMDEFAVQPLVVDENHFDLQHYTFEPVGWEYLGDIRCLVIDVHPLDPASIAAFEGRIWVEDHNYAIVRLNGARIHPPHPDLYVHFDTWRENLLPGVWLPVYVYSQEAHLGKRLRFKAETRLWGYDLTARREQQEWTNIMVDAPAPVRDSSEKAFDLTPVESQRQLTMQAERNVLARLEKARLIAPPGPVDKVLETVVNNLKVTNHLDNMPPVQCRVMLTSSLESFSLAYTIVLSRGLIDVLPDEASLAAVVAHELAHIALGHKLDTMNAFNDRMQIPDEKLLSRLDVARDRGDEMAADAKGMEFLKNSPYKDKLGQAGLFLRAAAAAAPHVPHLFGPHLGNGLTGGNNKLMRMGALISASPELSPRNVSQVAALPLGSRVQVNALDGTIAFTPRKAVPLVDAGEKLPFRITPVTPYLRFYDPTSKNLVSAKN